MNHGENPNFQAKEDENEWNIRIKGIVFGLIPVVIMGVVLFGSSGTLFWPMAWVILGTLFLATTLVTLFCSPDLITERMVKKPGVKKWDSFLVTVMNVMGFLTLFVAGLDMRFNWTGEMVFSIQIAALCFFLSGYLIFSWAMLSNRFFSTVVRIQEEKGHYAIMSGPYRFVRHPGYMGFILIVLAQPLMLGSLWALFPGVVTAALFVVRTRKEDDVLVSELNGYSMYIQEVKYRLIPGIW